MKKREFPKNPDCPLTEVERVKLSRMLDEIEWREYQPVRHITGGYAEVEVTDYDELEINVKVKTGVDGDHHDEFTAVIQREEILLIN